MAKQLLMGNEALAHAALEAGVNVVAGYPGTPSSEIVETIAKLHAAGTAHGVYVEWSTNEKAALELLGGAAYAGARCLFTCKQMGLNVATDPLMCLNYVGVRGGLVLLVADDPGPISSQTEQDTRRYAAFAKVPVLDPATPEQAFAMMKAAFDLSERYRTPVIVRPTTRVDHASAFFDIEDETFARPLPEEGFVRDVPKWVIFPARAYQAHGEINERLPQIARDFATEGAIERCELAAFNPASTNGFAAVNIALAPSAETALSATAEAIDVPAAASALPQTWHDARLGIVAGGVSAAYAREALAMLEERAAQAGVALPPYRFMQLGTAYPFPTELTARFTSGLDEVLALEELDYVLEDEFVRFAGRTHATYNVRGKITGDARDRGENDVDDILLRLARYLGVEELVEGVAAPTDGSQACGALDLPVRPPVLCPGCPHRGSFYAVKQALGKRPAIYCGDIGCYTLGNAKPLDAVDTCLCMGAGITMAQGFAVADPGKKAVAFVGDSTFFASGMTGVANAAYNNHDITVVVLDNATTAMTGAQPHPGTGVTLMGPRNTPLSIEAVLRANGIQFVIRANPLDHAAAVEAARQAIDFEGPSAVIYESPCIQLIKPAAPVIINPAVCTGCKKCITSIGCPGIGFDTQAEGPKSGQRGQAFVDAGSCNGCGLCVQMCPFGAIELPSHSDDAVSGAPAAPVQPAQSVSLQSVPEEPASEGGAHA